MHLLDKPQSPQPRLSSSGGANAKKKKKNRAAVVVVVARCVSRKMISTSTLKSSERRRIRKRWFKSWAISPRGRRSLGTVSAVNVWEDAQGPDECVWEQLGIIMKLERGKSPREVEAGVWERIRGRPEASVIYTCLSAKDTPLTVNHAAAARTQKTSGATPELRRGSGGLAPNRTQQQWHSTTWVQIFSNCSLDLWFSTVPGPTPLFFTWS